MSAGGTRQHEWRCLLPLLQSVHHVGVDVFSRSAGPQCEKRLTRLLSIESFLLIIIHRILEKGCQGDRTPCHKGFAPCLRVTEGDRRVTLKLRKLTKKGNFMCFFEKKVDTLTQCLCTGRLQPFSRVTRVTQG